MSIVSQQLRRHGPGENLENNVFEWTQTRSVKMKILDSSARFLNSVKPRIQQPKSKHTL